MKSNTVREMANVQATATATRSREDAFALPDPDSTETSVTVSCHKRFLLSFFNAEVS